MSSTKNNKDVAKRLYVLLGLLLLNSTATATPLQNTEM
jgi:hypothetical protein